MKPTTVEKWKVVLYEARREYMTSEVKTAWPWPSLTDHLAEVVVKTLSKSDEALEAIDNQPPGTDHKPGGHQVSGVATA